MEIKIGKLKLKNPVMVASGTFGYAKEFEGLVNLKRLGAIVTKTITLKPRQGNPMPRTCETASGMLNSIGLQNEGVEDFIDDKLPYLSKVGVPIIVSISGDSIGDFRKIAGILDRENGVDGIELNISCPNVRRQRTEMLIAQSKDATYEVVKKVRKVTAKTLITKLSPNVTDIVEIAQAACRGGTDAVSLINTLFGMARVGIDWKQVPTQSGNRFQVNRETGSMFLRGGLSGPCIKPIALRMVWEVARHIKKPVIGIGGIMSSEDAIDFLLAGAKAVQVGTANFVEPGICEKIIRKIQNPNFKIPNKSKIPITK